MTTDRMPALLEPIQNRRNAAKPAPWDRHDAQIRHTQIDGWVDPEGRNAAQEQTERDIQFVMNAPTDQACLLAAIRAVVAEIADTDLETNEAQQGDLADRILVAVEAALGGEA